MDDPPVVAIPVGSCEQHGPHLPLGTDTLIAEELARSLAQRVDGVLVGPAITVTASGEHADFPGTLSIGTAAMTQVIVELGRSADWARGLVLVNGHGGNREAVDAAAAVLRAEGRRVLSWWPRVPGGDAHAGETETAIVLAVHPELVRREAAVAGPTASLAELGPALRRDGVRAVSPNGVLGDPATASVELGRELLTVLVDDLVDAVTGFLATPPDRAEQARP